MSPVVRTAILAGLGAEQRYQQANSVIGGTPVEVQGIKTAVEEWRQRQAKEASPKPGGTG